MRIIGFFVLAVSIPLFAADMVMMRDGTRHYGTFVNSSGRAITFEENGARQNYDISQIQSLEFDPTITARTAVKNASGTFADRNSSTPSSRAGYGSGRTVTAAAEHTIPAGTEFPVRTNEEIQSTSAADGRFYSAVVDRDISDSTGQVVIPKGSAAQLVVRDVKSGGAVGSADLVLDIHSVTLYGRTYLVSTTDLQRAGGREGLGRNRRTAEIVGGTAALGTLLGAIAGGGRGAAIGALAGAAAGAGVQVLTRGKEVRVPAETVLTFRLDQPLRLQGS